MPAAHARDPHGEGQEGERVQQGDDLAGRATFIRGDGIICYFNSTELRCIISEGGIVEAKNAAGDSCWEIDREEEVRGEDYCR